MKHVSLFFFFFFFCLFVCFFCFVLFLRDSHRDMTEQCAEYIYNRECLSCADLFVALGASGETETYFPFFFFFFFFGGGGWGGGGGGYIYI